MVVFRREQGLGGNAKLERRAYALCFRVYAVRI